MMTSAERWHRILLVVFWLLVVVGLPGLVSVVPDWRAGSEPAATLHYTSVQVTPGAERILDADRARRIIGDRPIVVLVEPAERCVDLRHTLPGLILLVVRDNPDQPLFACGDATAGYDTEMLLSTEDAVSFLDTGEPIVYVEEFVRAFDAHVAAAFPGEPPPRREPPVAEPGGLDRNELKFLIGLGVYIAVLALVSGHLIRYARRDKRAPAAWRATSDARLNRLADLVLRVDESGRTAEERSATAKRYVRALQEFEAAVTEEQRAAVDKQLTVLERSAGIARRRER